MRDEWGKGRLYSELATKFFLDVICFRLSYKGMLFKI
jgi:hypothetical protein